MTLETAIERTVASYAESKGVLQLKLNVHGRVGWPDRLFIYYGRAYFVEFKRPGEELRPAQRHIHAVLQRHRQHVFTVDTVVEGCAIIDKLVRI